MNGVLWKICEDSYIFTNKLTLKILLPGLCSHVEYERAFRKLNRGIGSGFSLQQPVFRRLTS